MTLANGTRLGPYEIVGPLGAGGMGEVYHGRDTRLGRSVAIKVLPSEFARDSRRRLRFEREARAISALNHPHICTLHDVGNEKEIDYLVLELCDGTTLSGKITDGPLPIGQVYLYGIQIADALHKAHLQGIIHRDLKPANVMVTRSGVKVLDFGLAKEQGPVLADGPTESIEQLSEDGALVGTIQYMAPEVLSGKSPDARSDIFALGLILYEMVTGTRGRPGVNRGALAAIAGQEMQPIAKLRPDAPPALIRVINACLVRDPDERLQSAYDLKLELEWASQEAAPAPGGRGTEWMTFAVLVATLAIASAIALAIRRPAVESRPLRRLAINLPASAPVRSAFGVLMAVSPDGKRLVYVSPDGLRVRDLDNVATTLLPGTEDATSPFFSPDGAWVGFATDRALKKVALAGGSPVTICESDQMRGAAWGPGDTIILMQNFKPAMRVPATGGTPEPLGRATSLRWPSFLPDSEDILVTVYSESGHPDRNDVALLRSTDGKLRTILRGASHGQYTAGHLLYMRSGAVYSVPFDARAGQITGAPKPIVDDMSWFAGSGVAHLTVSGPTVYYTPYDEGQNQRELLWVDRSGRATAVGDQRRGYAWPALSPSGAQIATEICQRGTCDIWRYEIARGTWTRVTSDGHSITPIWSPDERSIVYRSNRTGPYNLYIIPSDGSGGSRQMTHGRHAPTPFSWSPDGKQIAVAETRTATGLDISFIPVDGSAPSLYLATPARDFAGMFSPDGRWLVYESAGEIFVRAANGQGATWQVSDKGGRTPHWRGDGREIFYLNGSTMMAADITLTPSVGIARPRVLFEVDSPGYGFDVTRDGQRFLMTRQPEQAPQTQINVVEGLFEER